MKKSVWRSKLAPSQISQILHLWETGTTAQGIAYEFGVSLSTIYRWIRRSEKKGSVSTKIRNYKKPGFKPVGNWGRSFNILRRNIHTDRPLARWAGAVNSPEASIFKEHADLPWSRWGGSFNPPSISKELTDLTLSRLGASMYPSEASIPKDHTDLHFSRLRGFINATEASIPKDHADIPLNRLEGCMYPSETSIIKGHTNLPLSRLECCMYPSEASIPKDHTDLTLNRWDSSDNPSEASIHKGHTDLPLSRWGGSGNPSEASVLAGPTNLLLSRLEGCMNRSEASIPKDHTDLSLSRWCGSGNRSEASVLKDHTDLPLSRWGGAGNPSQASVLKDHTEIPLNRWGCSDNPSEASVLKDHTDLPLSRLGGSGNRSGASVLKDHTDLPLSSWGDSGNSSEASVLKDHTDLTLNRWDGGELVHDDCSEEYGRGSELQEQATPSKLADILVCCIIGNAQSRRYFDILIMNWINTLRVATIVLTFRSSGGSRSLLAGVVTEAVDSSQDDQVTELSLLMDILDREYIANCLRVVLTTQESKAVNHSTIDLSKQTISGNSLFSMNEKDNIPGDKPVMYFDRAKMAITDIKRELDTIVTKAHTFTPVKCVSYLLSGPPDPELMGVLTNQLLRKKLTRYFLVHTQNSTEAQQFLLDQRLGKEENVAALVQEESPNKSYWRVLIRQLLHPSGSPQVLTVNRWSRDTGLASAENIFPEQMANFYGTKLTAIALTLIPAVAYERTEGSLVVKLRPCLDKSLVDTVAKKLNFTYQVVVPADGIWGYPNEKGEFNGLVREVEVGRANFSLSLSKIQVRMRVIDYTLSYYMDALTFITAKRQPPPPWYKVLTPFRTNVWLCVLVSVGGGSLLYHVIYHAQATLTSSRLLSSRAFMHILASFLNQSLEAYLSLQSGRVFMGFWFLYSFLVTSYYKTSLTSTLAVPFIPKNIDTAEELVESGLPYGITPSKGAVYTIFALASIPLHQRMFTNLKYHKSADSFKMVEEGQYSFVYWKSFLDPRVARHNNNPNRKNDIHMAKDTLFPGSKAWIVPKGAPYERTFTGVIKRCVQVGLITKWQKDAVDSFLKVWQKEDNPEGKLVKGTERKEVSFSLDHLQGPFFMLLLGYIGGVLLLVLEVLMGK